jgi:hypothetical protein
LARDELPDELKCTSPSELITAVKVPFKTKTILCYFENAIAVLNLSKSE